MSKALIVKMKRVLMTCIWCNIRHKSRNRHKSLRNGHRCRIYRSLHDRLDSLELYSFIDHTIDMPLWFTSIQN